MADAEPTDEQQELLDRKAYVVKQWTLPENWSPDGNEWLGQTLPPWGTKNRCAAIRCAAVRMRRPIS